MHSAEILSLHFEHIVLYCIFSTSPQICAFTTQANSTSVRSFVRITDNRAKKFSAPATPTIEHVAGKVRCTTTSNLHYTLMFLLRDGAVDSRAIRTRYRCASAPFRSSPLRFSQIRSDQSISGPVCERVWPHLTSPAPHRSPQRCPCTDLYFYVVLHGGGASTAN